MDSSFCNFVFNWMKSFPFCVSDAIANILARNGNNDNYKLTFALLKNKCTVLFIFITAAALFCRCAQLITYTIGWVIQYHSSAGSSKTVIDDSFTKFHTEADFINKKRGFIGDLSQIAHVKCSINQNSSRAGLTDCQHFEGSVDDQLFGGDPPYYTTMWLRICELVLFLEIAENWLLLPKLFLQLVNKYHMTKQRCTSSVAAKATGVTDGNQK